MKLKERKGFTLIEILIVVAIIAILASVVLVGLGPTQEAGRDARRISDLSEVQNGLELFYSKCGAYPDATACAPASAVGNTWGSFTTALTSAGIGITQVPSDPSTGRSYDYGYTAGGTQYILTAVLENPANSVFTSYSSSTLNVVAASSTFLSGASGTHATTCTPPDYCVTL